MSDEAILILTLISTIPLGILFFHFTRPNKQYGKKRLERMNRMFDADMAYRKYCNKKDDE